MPFMGAALDRFAVSSRGRPRIVVVPVSGGQLITEASAYILTESSDNLVTET